MDEKQIQRIHYEAMKQAKIDLGSKNELVFLALALAGEAGELANVVKKIWRDGDSPELQVKLRHECADVILYMKHILAALDTTEEVVVAEKMEVLRERWPQFFKEYKRRRVEGMES